MAGIVKKLDRVIIPRWRRFADAAKKGELKSSRSTLQGKEDFLLEKKRAWRQSGTIWYATDLVGAAVALRRTNEVLDAARFIVEADEAPSPAKRMAERILSGASTGSAAFANLPAISDIRSEIAQKRASVREDPRNAIQWVELARSYTIIGLRTQAERAVRTALNLNKENRFILRAAARFYLHNDQPDHAHHILRTAPNSKGDPWLTAAEIAVASAAGREARFVDSGRKLLASGKHGPSQVTELASALATLELSNGKNKVARNLFRTSLLEPNENSLAQAEWAADQVKGLDVDVENYEIPDKYEAAAWEYFNRGNWELSLANARAWLSDQAFSSRPAILASYVAECMLENYEVALVILEDSLKANPKNAFLLNNAAFALARLDRLEEADAKIRQIDISKVTESDRTVIAATEGLIAYRLGNIEMGRSLYNEALKMAERLKDRKLHAEALTFFVQEEIRARTARANEMLARTLEIIEEYNEPKLMRRAELLRAHAINPPKSSAFGTFPRKLG